MYGNLDINRFRLPHIMSHGIIVNLKNENKKRNIQHSQSSSQMISSFEFPQLWEANSDIQLLIAMHEMDLAVL